MLGHARTSSPLTRRSSRATRASATTEWEKFREQGKIKARQLAEGTQLTSNRFSYQYITKMEDGYVRVFDNGRVEKFDEDGKLAAHRRTRTATSSS